jgi:hypothetical protein
VFVAPQFLSSDPPSISQFFKIHLISCNKVDPTLKTMRDYKHLNLQQCCIEFFIRLGCRGGACSWYFGCTAFGSTLILNIWYINIKYLEGLGTVLAVHLGRWRTTRGRTPSWWQKNRVGYWSIDTPTTTEAHHNYRELESSLIQSATTGVTDRTRTTCRL